MKLKLNDDQLFRANEVYFALGKAEMKVHRLKRAYDKMIADLQAETGHNLTGWAPTTGETNIDLPEPEVEVIPPRKKRKSTSL